MDPDVLGPVLGLEAAKVAGVSGATVMLTDWVKTMFRLRGPQTRIAKSVIALVCSLIAYYPGHLPSGWPLAKIVGAGLLCALIAAKTADKRRETNRTRSEGE